MAIKQSPTNFRTYYKLMRELYTKKYKDSLNVLEEKRIEERALYEDIKDKSDILKKDYNFDVYKYEEFVNNEYNTGDFLSNAHVLFNNKKDDNKIVGILYLTYKFAKLQKEVYDLNNVVNKYDKIINLTLREYSNILQTFYNEVHKHLIKEGEAYTFEGMLGSICINRCKLVSARKKIDYAATKKKRAELEAKGIRIYKREEAEWCKNNGITYEATDPRVYKDCEYCYEFPLMNCRITNGGNMKFTVADYRGTLARKLSNDELLEYTKGDIDKICDLSIDVKTKFNIAIKANPLLYSKYIRNEKQLPYHSCTTNRKD